MDNLPTQLPLHLFQNVTVERLLAVLEAIDGNYAYDDVVQAPRQLTRLRMLNLVESDNVSLTHVARALLQLHQATPNCAQEVWHFLHYSGWRSSAPLEHPQLFFYRCYCDFLYDRDGIDLEKRDDREKICIDIAEVIRHSNFFPPERLQSLSLSPDSLAGVHNILNALHPPVLEGNTFQRRDFCEPPLMLLAFNYALRDDPDALDVNILLSDELREQICRICLLDPAYFDQTLDWMLPLYPDIITTDPEVGYYGRYVRLKKLPTIEDLVP